MVNRKNDKKKNHYPSLSRTVSANGSMKLLGIKPDLIGLKVKLQ